MAHPLVRRCLISLSAPFACHWYSRGDNGQNLDFGSLYYDWHRCYSVGIRIAIVIKVSYYNEIPLPICSSRMLSLRCGVRSNFPYHWINPKIFETPFHDNPKQISFQTLSPKRRKRSNSRPRTTPLMRWGSPNVRTKVVSLEEADIYVPMPS